MNRFVGWVDDCVVLLDDELVQRARAGDDLAFEELVRRYSGQLHAHAMGFVRDPVEAQDAVQDTFLSAYRKLDSFRGDAPFSSWLYRICTNACLMRLRTRRRRPEVLLEMGTEDERPEAPQEDPAPGAHEFLESVELGGRILEGASTLPEPYRQVFERADLEHMSMAEIAQDLDITVSNVKTRLHRARVRLRHLLLPYLEAEPRVT